MDTDNLPSRYEHREKRCRADLPPQSMTVRACWQSGLATVLFAIITHTKKTALSGS